MQTKRATSTALNSSHGTPCHAQMLSWWRSHTSRFLIGRFPNTCLSWSRGDVLSTSRANLTCQHSNERGLPSGACNEEFSPWLRHKQKLGIRFGQLITADNINVPFTECEAALTETTKLGLRKIVTDLQPVIFTWLTSGFVHLHLDTFVARLRMDFPVWIGTHRQLRYCVDY